MRFWDSSCIVPLCIIEPISQDLKQILKSDETIIVWWATRIECISAFIRRVREGILDINAEEQARNILQKLNEAWLEVQPTQYVKDIAERLLAVHKLRTLDSLQLAAALVWCENSPNGCDFVSMDRVLREAARKEGFTILPIRV